MNSIRKLCQRTIGWVGLFIATQFYHPAGAVTLYQVFVISDQDQDLAQVQTLVPDAIFVRDQSQTSILAGTFLNQIYAAERQAELEVMGLTVSIVTREDNGEPPPPSPSPEPDPATPSPASPSTPTVTPTAPSTSTTSPTPSPVANPLSTPAPPEVEPISELRAYAVLVPNPNGDPNLATQIRRFFPSATDVLYQRYPALQTGSFSQLSQAQEQARWLTFQGFPALAVPSPQVFDPSASSGTPPRTPESPTLLNPTPAPSISPQVSQPVPPSSDPQVAEIGELWWVFVADPVGDTLSDLQAIIPEATPLIYDDLQVVKTGGYSNQADAETQQVYLASQGYEAGIFPAELERTEPVFQPVSPTTASAAGFFVIVTSSNPEATLDQIQTIAPDAFLRQYQNQDVIQVGSYRLRLSAEEAVQALQELGLEGEIVSRNPSP